MADMHPLPARRDHAVYSAVSTFSVIDHQASDYFFTNSLKALYYFRPPRGPRSGLDRRPVKLPPNWF
jgi:hypothetical protein